MKIYQAAVLSPKTLVNYLRDKHIDYGDKFERFNEQAASKFQRCLQLSFKTKKYGKDINNLELPCTIFAVILLKKIQRASQQPDFNRKQFLEDIRYKSKQIVSKNNFSPQTAERFFQSVSHVINDPSQLPELFQVHNKYIYELINMCAQVKTKQFQMIDHYSPEQMIKISNVFRQKFYFINYDKDKDALNNITIDSRYIYLLKAKELYFMLVKLQDITVVRTGTISHQELAEIFQITHKLENQVVKQSIVPTTQDLIPSKARDQQTPKKETLDVTEISLLTKGSPQRSPNTTTMSLIKKSSLFPEEVKCKICCKQLSQFNTLYWNYADYCLECVVSPRVDISFVPTTVIKKYLKSMRYDTNTPYHVICPECKSQGAIKNYRVQDKARDFRCGACDKKICIEHQKLILECFCFCVKCKKQTITIQSLFLKYCANCKTRCCELCGYKGQQQCSCICKKCKGPNLVDHDCNPYCHGCKGTNFNLQDCPCGSKLCSICFFKSLDPNESICIKSA